MLDLLYQKIDGHSADSLEARPVIGISANRRKGVSCVADPYFQSVVMAGGAPVILPVTTDVATLATIVDRLDGLILSGGGDIHSGYLDEAPVPELGDTDAYRDEYDFIVLRLAFNRQLPIFGICRGHQVINVAFGGAIYQDIHAQYSKEALKHSQDEARHVATHDVTLAEIPSRLWMAINKPETFSLPVNSFHHQSIKRLAPEFIATATAPDGVNEAMEHPEYPIFSVQWHPEPMAAAGNETMLDLFRYHIRQASVFAKAKKLHHRMVTIDSHTDTPMLIHEYNQQGGKVSAQSFDLGGEVNTQSFDLGRKQGGKVNLPLMEEGRLDAVFMAAYVPQGERDEVSLLRANQHVEERLASVIAQVEKYPHRMGIARTAYDLWRLKQEGKKAVFLGVENGYAIGKNLNNLQRLKDLGVSYITLCHNGDNDICDSALGNGTWGGLSPFGIEVVAEMNRLGLVIDVSHAAVSTFYDVLKYSAKPVIASHSSSRALCDHPRNLDDDQLRALASQGGVVQLCLYKPFINQQTEKASLSDAIRHLKHMIDIAGIDHVGIGSDFDGDGELIGCRAANELIQITMRLLIEGFDDASISKIWGENLLRVMGCFANGKWKMENG